MNKRKSHYFYVGTNQYEAVKKTQSIKADMDHYPALSVGDDVEINEITHYQQAVKRKHVRTISAIQLPLFSCIQTALLSLSAIKRNKRKTSPLAG